MQDYHLQLVPAMLRELRPDLRIGFFMHVPFPPPELFMQLPRRIELLRGMLGADLVGFQTQHGAHNFAQLAARLLGTDGRPAAIQVDGRMVRPAPSRSPIDVDEMERSRPRRRASSDRAGRLRARPRRTRQRCCSASTGSTTPRASSTASRRTASCSRDGRVKVRDTVMVQVAVPSRERVEQLPRCCGTGSSARSAGSTASSAGSA